MAEIDSARFTVEQGTRILVQVPHKSADQVLAAILQEDPLSWGDYDQVAYTTSVGQQQFRSLSGGRNMATNAAVGVACVELQVFVPRTGQALGSLICAIYHAHPYEEPVIQLIPAYRCCHIRGQDEANPNRFWNQETADWVPEAHR